MGITNKQKWLIFFIVGIIMFSISFYSHQREKKMLYEVSGKADAFQVELNGAGNDENKSETGLEEEKEEEKVSESPTIWVHVEGAVTAPGLYELKEENRVADAIEAAGGLTDKADRPAVNLAMKLQDGIQVYIPEKGEIISTMMIGGVLPSNNTESQVPKKTSLGGKININQASQGELTQLQGIGEALANRIIEYRQQQGPFKSIEEIKNVSGIGDKKFQQIKDMIITN